MKICIVGFGFVGNAIYNSLLIRNFKEDINLFIYDKYKNGGIGKINYDTDIMFLCLPTPYDEKIYKYNIESIIETFDILKNNNYKGIIVLKSTIEPETTFNLSNVYSNLTIFHNPEFLSAKTAIQDFNNQKHIVIGSPYNDNKYTKIDILIDFYKKYYPDSNISLCKSIESESMKIFCNSFYAIKIQFFTELYLLCKNNNSDFEKIKELMLKNEWINPMHTNVPGPDGQISYGGLCLPKDILALNSYMSKNETQNLIVKSTINERNNLRK